MMRSFLLWPDKAQIDQHGCDDPVVDHHIRLFEDVFKVTVYQNAHKTREHPRTEAIRPVELLPDPHARAVQRPAAGVQQPQQHEDKCAKAHIAHLDKNLEIVVIDVEILQMVDDLILHGDRAAEHA